MRVSLPLTAERGRIYTGFVALCVLAALVVAAGAPQAAHAEFTLKRCQGGAVEGEGSSFQAAAQALLQIDYNEPFGCEGSIGKVTYFSDGSGCGIASIGGGGSTGKCSNFESASATAGFRATDTRFGGSDAPLTPEQQTAADAVGSQHPGLIHILPIAIGATTVIVHFPEGCQLENPAQTNGNGNTSTGGYPVPEAKAGEVKAGEEDRNNDPVGAYTGDTFANGTLRVHIPAGILEKIWDGSKVTWGEVVSEKFVAGSKPTNALEVEEGFTKCGEVPVRRIVRFDGSGTTYNFKAYLGLLPVGVGGSSNNPIWEKSPVAGTNTTWPLTTSSTGVPKTVPTKAGTKEVVNECNETVSGPDRICTGSANGNPFVAAAVAATDGSIGYSDLATARQNGFTITPESENGGKPDDTYWIPLQTVNPEEPVSKRVGTNYVEPSSSPTSNIGNKKEIKGSNCTNADFRGIPAITTGDPDPTLGDWANAIGTGSKDTTTYPNCAITYDFVWDDDSTVYGKTLEEQEKARSIKDYFTVVESEGGQLSLKGEDYGALPPEIIKIARIGVEAIGWEKTAGGGGSKEEVKTPPKEEKTVVTTPVVTLPSNAFSIANAKVKGKDIALSLVLPDAGKVQIKATGGGVTVASESASVSGGKGNVTLTISKAAIAKLDKAKGHKLSVKITITFTPTGGTAASKTKTLTITKAEVSPPKKGKKK